MSTATATDRFLTVQEAATTLRLTPDTIYRLIHSGRLKAVRVGERGPVRVPESALAALLQPTSSAAHPDPSLRADHRVCAALDADEEEDR